MLSFNTEQPLPKCALTRLAERSKRTLRHFSEIEGNNPQLCLQWRVSEPNQESAAIYVS